jgi:hypothetical protein
MKAVMRTALNLFALFMVFCVPVATAGDTAADLQKEFVGFWKLISIEGPAPPNGQANTGKPSGVIMFDNTGHMAVQLTRGDRPAFAEGAANGTAQERAQAYSSYNAYYGTYTIEPANRVVIYHLENSLNPGQIGQDFVRYFEFQGNHLRLSVADDDKGGRRTFKDTIYHFNWEKMSNN